MKVSIIIVNWNTKSLLQECIKSIYKSKPKESFEVIVVDNGSSDGSVQMVSKLASKYHDLILIRNKENLGFSKANNIGIRKSSGDYKLLLNSDTKVKLHTIDRLVSFAEENSDVGVIGGRLLNKDGSVQESVFRLPSLWRTIRQYWLGERKLLDKYAPDSNKAVEVESVVGACFLITPAALNEVGLLDERFFMFFEDLEYCRRVKEAGFKIYYLPNAEVFHLHGESGRKLADEDNQWRRLIKSSKIYHGGLKHYLVYIVMWSGQKARTLFS